ncbi:MAG TPA: hypothetical protein VKI62_06080, partial [Bacteroidota bacterium]|nr:hypothetical protein [Bacteroidota bacterium]
TTLIAMRDEMKELKKSMKELKEATKAKTTYAARPSCHSNTEAGYRTRTMRRHPNSYIGPHGKELSE